MLRASSLRHLQLWPHRRPLAIMGRMTQQGEPHLTTPDTYITALAERLAADGCETEGAEWQGGRVLVGRRSDKSARWGWTRVHLFTVAAGMPEVDAEALFGFTRWAMQYAKEHKGGGLPLSYGNVITVFPVLVGGTVHPAAKDWAREDVRVAELAVAARPVVVDTHTAEVALYRGKPLHGRMFAKHILDKADLYFP